MTISVELSKKTTKENPPAAVRLLSKPYIFKKSKRQVWMYLPLCIDLQGKKVLIIGLGKVGKKRLQKLLKSGAEVAVIDRRKIRVKNAKFTQKNLCLDNLPSLEKYFLVVASTDDEKLNEAIAKKARRDGCLVNRVDLFRGGDVIFPAVVETRAGIISFTTIGRNPRLSRQIKEALEREFSKD